MQSLVPLGHASPIFAVPEEARDIAAFLKSVGRARLGRALPEANRARDVRDP